MEEEVMVVMEEVAMVVVVMEVMVEEVMEVMEEEVMEVMVEEAMVVTDTIRKEAKVVDIMEVDTTPREVKEDTIPEVVTTRREVKRKNFEFTIHSLVVSLFVTVLVIGSSISAITRKIANECEDTVITLYHTAYVKKACFLQRMDEIYGKSIYTQLHCSSVRFL